MKRSGSSSGSGGGRPSSRWGGSKRDKRDGDKSSSSSSHYGPAHVEDDEVVNSKKRRKKEEQDGYDDRYGGRNNNNDDDDDDNNKTNNDKEVEEKEEPEYKPNFGLSGALAKDMQTGNVYKGVQLKFREPPEARAPNTQWRFYVFKKGQDGVLETLHISKQSAYLMGRNTDIADIPLLHPSLSSQHAVLQYRAVPVRSTAAATVVANVGEMPRLTVQPYIMDLESTNGTFLNGVQIDPARYYQLKKGDVLTFGASTREYVLMTENTTST